MEVNISSSDDETPSSPLSPKLGGKKQKLNDGSSQESEDKSTNEGAPSSRDDKDRISVDRSEGSSDDRTVGTSSGPSNEVVNIGPSASNVGTILLSVRRPVLNWRNYRKRRPPGSDSDSNDASSFDSDDNSNEEQPQRRSSTNSDPESDVRRMFSDDSPSASSSSSTSSNYQYDSDDLNVPIETDSDSDNIMLRTTRDPAEDENKPAPRVLLKNRPKHEYCLLREIMNREMGLSFPCGKAAKSDVLFEKRFYGSLHAIYRLKKLHHLNKHRGCVNSINFHPEGHLLASGSDDTNVVIWDWARNKALETIKTGHKSNVFQSKFLYLNAQSQLNIVTCARDGQVRLIQCPPSGGGAARRRLGSHARAAHKLHVCAHEPHSVVSCGEDGLVLQCDVRAERPHRLFHVKERGMSIPLYSVFGHPLEPRKLLVAGRDRFLRVYDTRKSLQPVALYCPSHFVDNEDTKKVSRRSFGLHLTCAVYSHDGAQILGSYNDEDIYLFDAAGDAYDKDHVNEEKDYYSRRYSGHRNSATFKGVSFFGPKSEYIVSGSDCSNIYVWDKQTEAIVQWVQGDVNGVVNCVEAHPRCPVLASSGLDKDVKLWMARAHRDPDFSGLERVVRDNNVSQLRSPLFNDFLPTLYNAWRDERSYSVNENAQYGGNIDFDGNVCAMI